MISIFCFIMVDIISLSSLKTTKYIGVKGGGPVLSDLWYDKLYADQMLLK